MITRSLSVLIFLGGLIIGGAVVGVIFNKIHDQERDLAKFSIDGIILKNYALIMQSYKTRGKDESFPQFFNCLTKDKYERVDNALTHGVHGYKWAVSTRSSLVTQLKGDLEMAREQLEKDRVNSCPTS